MPLYVRILLYIVLCAVLLVAYVRLLECKTIFYPSKEISMTPEDVGLVYEDVYFSTDDNIKLNGWFIKAPSDSGNRVTLLFLHGNAGNISDRLGKIASFHSNGFNIFIVDYRGYGKSEGRPTEKGIYLDVKAAYKYLKKREDIDQDKIVAYGVSLGGVAAVYVAANFNVNGLVLDSTFTSAAEMGKKILPFVPSFLISVKFDSIGRIKGVKIPKLILHSTEDEMIPYVFGKKLYDAASQPKEFVDIEGTHNEGYLLFNDTFYGSIKNFLQRHELF